MQTSFLGVNSHPSSFPNVSFKLQPLKTVKKGVKEAKNGEKNIDGQWYVKPVIMNYKQ